MKLIGLEEHFLTPEIFAALNSLPPEQRDDSLSLYQMGPTKECLFDLGEERLRQVDLVDPDRMVLSLTTPATQILPPAQAVPLARQANDRLAATARPPRPAGRLCHAANA